MSNIEKIVADALSLKSEEKIELIEKLLVSFYPLSDGIDKLWSDESEERIDSYENGHLPILEQEETFAKYKK